MKGAAAIAERHGVKAKTPGVFIGRSDKGRKPLFASNEDMHVDNRGPLTGKTTRLAVPAILDGPGAVLVTSNKRDIEDSTRGPRSARGPDWVFDPQQVAAEPPS
ncbi:conjugal transfer protein, partial [Streptomyces sp. SP18BB07]|nr:conjugal transfer protein [Streptomyces sp. SP18BB07]